MDSNDALVVFKGAKIRRIWQYEQWYFSVVEVIQAITDSVRQRKYWSDLSEKIGHLKIEVYDKIVLLKMALRTEHKACSVNTGRRYG